MKSFQYEKNVHKSMVSCTLKCEKQILQLYFHKINGVTEKMERRIKSTNCQEHIREKKKKIQQTVRKL